MRGKSMIRPAFSGLLLSLLALACGAFASCAGKPDDPVGLVRYHLQAVKNLASAVDQEPATKREKILAYWAGAKTDLDRAIAQLQAQAAKAGNGPEGAQFDAQIESIFNDLRDLGLVLMEQGVQLEPPSAG